MKSKSCIGYCPPSKYRYLEYKQIIYYFERNNKIAAIDRWFVKRDRRQNSHELAVGPHAEHSNRWLVHMLCSTMCQKWYNLWRKRKINDCCALSHHCKLECNLLHGAHIHHRIESIEFTWMCAQTATHAHDYGNCNLSHNKMFSASVCFSLHRG